MRMRKKWILPGSCAVHKMGRKSAYFRVHAHVHLAGSGGMRMCLTLNGYGNSSQRTVINSKNGHATKTRNPPHAVGDTYRLNKTLLKINKLLHM